LIVFYNEKKCRRKECAKRAAVTHKCGVAATIIYSSLGLFGQKGRGAVGWEKSSTKRQNF
jgi:hypothetical protein